MRATCPALVWGREATRSCPPPVSIFNTSLISSSIFFTIHYLAKSNRKFVWRCYPYDRWSTLRLSGCDNKLNFRCWAERKSTAAPATASFQCTCDWCGVANFRVIGLYFFEDEDGRAVNSHICSLCWNITELPHTRTESSWNWALDHMVPAR
jgi:hypothetical protein